MITETVIVVHYFDVRSVAKDINNKINTVAKETRGHGQTRSQTNTTYVSHLSHVFAYTLRSVPAWIMTCQCCRSSAISVVIWFLPIYILFHQVSPSQLWSTSISLSIYCHIIFLVASSLPRLCTCPNHINLFSLRNSAIGYMPLSRCLHFSDHPVPSFLLPTATCAFELCAISSPPSF